MVKIVRNKRKGVGLNYYAMGTDSASIKKIIDDKKNRKFSIVFSQVFVKISLKSA
jgi:hypothetical protein